MPLVVTITSTERPEVVKTPSIEPSEGGYAVTYGDKSLTLVGFQKQGKTALHLVAAALRSLLPE